MRFSTAILVLSAALAHRYYSSSNSSDITAVVLNWVRLQNVVQIVSTLCNEPAIKTIVVWNNNNLLPLVRQDFVDSQCHKLQIFNSPENLYFQARFLACANASTPYCFIQDDDYLVQPEVIRSLRARVTSQDIFLAPPDEWLASRSLSGHATNITFGFAWLGYGTLLHRSHASAFLSLLERLDFTTEQRQMADNYYSILRNRFPEVWITRPHPLFSGGAFTVGTEGVERNRRHIEMAAGYLDENIERVFDLPYMSRPSSSSREDASRSPCLQKACVFEFIGRQLPPIFTKQTHAAAMELFEREKLLIASMSQNLSANILEFPLAQAVDGHSDTSFRSSYAAAAGDTFILDMLTPTSAQHWQWEVDPQTAKTLRNSSFYSSHDQITWRKVDHAIECSLDRLGQCRTRLRVRGGIFGRLGWNSDMALTTDLHVKYIQNLGKSTDELMYHLTAHLRMNAIYWGLTALCVMGQPDALDKDDVIEFVLSCWDDQAGAFGAHPGHDAHIHPTLSAIQILVIYDSLHVLDVPRVTQFILSLQQPSGVFAGDSFGEIDTRFTYIAINALSLLGRLDQLDQDKTVEYFKQCRNFDGGFGNYVGGESHAGQVFVCVAALAILDRLDVVDHDTLAWWLSERQLPSGGLNGRPEKLADVCYSFWVLSALSILNKVHWIDCDKLTEFILSAQVLIYLHSPHYLLKAQLQDTEKGGIADRPDNVADVFHTQFGVAGLSILGYPGLVDLDPVYCMPASVIEAKGLRKGWKSLERRTV
ncbi:Rab geranylgeranyltransferase [Mycena kentingensis (nom. inval.)]|nr:Rab geranylgeranyltransferase [Mycena kentingensis (nom. inval.)]